MNAGAIYLMYAIFALGGVGLFLALPKGDRTRRAPGLTLALVALVALMAVLSAKTLAGAETPGLYFVLFASLALIATVRVITHERPVYSVVYFVFAIIAVAGMLLLLDAEFLAIGLVIVYAGAIMVTYVFVIMLAQQPTEAIHDHYSREPLAAVLGGFLLMSAISAKAVELPVAPPDRPRIGASLASATVQDAEAMRDASGDVVVSPSPREVPNIDAQGSNTANESKSGHVVGHTEQMGVMLTGQYAVVLQMAGLLLLISMVGAVALSRKRIKSDVVTPPQLPPGHAGRHVPPW